MSVSVWMWVWVWVYVCVHARAHTHKHVHTRCVNPCGGPEVEEEAAVAQVCVFVVVAKA